MLGTTTRRFIAGLVGLAVAVGLLGLAAPSANAETDLGDLIVTPTSGSSTAFIDMTTPEACPEGTVNFKISLTGEGITNTSDNNLLGLSSYAQATPAAGGGITATVQNTLKDIFQAYGILSPSGHYVINLRCQNSNGSTIFGDFLATINLVPTGTNFEGNYTYVPPTPNGVATTTTLVPAPVSPIKAGSTVSLTATISESAAAGSVQFKDGGTNLGAPVDVSGGAATKPGVSLAAGSHNLTAVFTSSDTEAFLSSTSAVTTYVVAGVPTITGTTAVGKTVTCTTSAGGTQTFAWLVNGVASSTTTKSVLVPAAWYAKSVTCRATFTHGAANVVQTSAAKKIAPGAKLVAKVKPKVLGTAKVGKILTCSKGTWSPAATSYKYQWLRGTKVIKGKVAAKYKAVRADKGKKISCKVTAIKAGYTSGLAASAARKIL